MIAAVALRGNGTLSGRPSFNPGAVGSEAGKVVLLESAPEAVVDPQDAAESAGLRYVSDERPGIRRRRSGKGFAYTRPDGTALTDNHVISRIKALVIPPAWTDVWICPFADGHIQVTGRDAKGRKQ